MDNIKRCSKCGCIKPIEQFHKQSRYCKMCHNEYQNQWRKRKMIVSEEFRKRVSMYDKKRREKSKSMRGDTYGSDRYAETRRAYQRAYLQKRKHEDKFKEELLKLQEWSKLQKIKESVRQLEDLIFYEWYGRQD